MEAGELAGLEDAAELQTPEKAVFRPADSARRDARYRRFEQYLDRLYAHR
jgi:xylulokinase